jgi:hypothetical protein
MVHSVSAILRDLSSQLENGAFCICYPQGLKQPVGEWYVLYRVHFSSETFMGEITTETQKGMKELLEELA